MCSIERIELIVKQIKDATDVGVMFYYGESQFEKSNYKTVTNEIKYKPYLL